MPVLSVLSLMCFHSHFFSTVPSLNCIHEKHFQFFLSRDALTEVVGRCSNTRAQNSFKFRFYSELSSFKNVNTIFVASLFKFKHLYMGDRKTELFFRAHCCLQALLNDLLAESSSKEYVVFGIGTYTSNLSYLTDDLIYIFVTVELYFKFEKKPKQLFAFNIC